MEVNKNWAQFLQTKSGPKIEDLKQVNSKSCSPNPISLKEINFQQNQDNL